VKARFFVDRRESTINEGGRVFFAPPSKAGAITPEHILGENWGEVRPMDQRLGRFLAARCDTLQSLGIAPQDLGSGRHYVLEKARTAGIGQVIWTSEPLVLPSGSAGGRARAAKIFRGVAIRTPSLKLNAELPGMNLFSKASHAFHSPQIVDAIRPAGGPPPRHRGSGRAPPLLAAGRSGARGEAAILSV